MVNRLALAALLALGLLASPQAPAQAAEPELFTQIKAKADKGDPEAQLALGSLYAAGNAVPRDLAKAAKWHRKAALQGLPRAQYQLGADYAAGDGVKLDKEEAVKWFRKAADQGLPDAQFVLGLAYENGKGIRQNAAEAVKWFRKAADQAFPDGEYELASCYLDGTGVAKDTQTGIKWLRQSAEAGCPSAQSRLGLCYQQGTGLPRDNVEAYKWLSLAAAQDDENAADIRVSLAKVEASLTPEQISQAQALARQFKPGPAQPPGPATAPAPSPAPPVADAPPTGTVNILADASGCEIFVDGNFVGNSPAKLQLPSGSHSVEVKLPGRKTFQRQLTVSAGSDLTLRAVLEKQ